MKEENERVSCILIRHQLLLFTALYPARPRYILLDTQPRLPIVYKRFQECSRGEWVVRHPWSQSLHTNTLALLSRSEYDRGVSALSLGIPVGNGTGPRRGWLTTPPLPCLPQVNTFSRKVVCSKVSMDMAWIPLDRELIPSIRLDSWICYRSYQGECVPPSLSLLE